jgi:hypothetical protein
MLRWVLLCDYCSYFSHFPKTSELGWAINAYIIIATYYHNHSLLFRVCSFTELSFAFITTAPEGCWRRKSLLDCLAGAEPDAHQFYVTVVFNG